MGWFEQDVEPSKHHHGQDNLLIVALIEGLYQHVVGNIPYKCEEGVVLVGVHYVVCGGVAYSLRGMRTCERDLPNSSSQFKTRLMVIPLWANCLLVIDL